MGVRQEGLKFWVDQLLSIAGIHGARLFSYVIAFRYTFKGSFLS